MRKQSSNDSPTPKVFLRNESPPLSRSQGTRRPFVRVNPVSLLKENKPSGDKPSPKWGPRAGMPRPPPPAKPVHTKKRLARKPKQPADVLHSTNVPVVAGPVPVVAGRRRLEGQFSIVYCLIGSGDEIKAEDVVTDLTEHKGMVIIIDCRAAEDGFAAELCILLNQCLEDEYDVEPLYDTAVEDNVVFGHLSQSFIHNTIPINDPLSRGASGAIVTLCGITVRSSKLLCGKTDWNIAFPIMPEGVEWVKWDVAGDINLIVENEIRVIVGAHHKKYMKRLRDQARLRNLMYRSYKTQLSRRGVVTDAIGPIRKFRYEKNIVAPQPRYAVGKGPTDEWALLEMMSVKKRPASTDYAGEQPISGIEKLLVFAGASNNFRTPVQKKARYMKGVHKGHCIDRFG